MISTVLSLLAVGLLWGATNPFIKLGSKGIDKVPDTGSKFKNLWLELKTIGKRLKYWIPFLLNQLGSVLFVWTLQSTSLTATVPIANSLSFAFTAITGYFLGEKLPGKKVFLGTALICMGSALIIYDKVLQSKEQIHNFKFESDAKINVNLST